MDNNVLRNANAEKNIKEYFTARNGKFYNTLSEIFGEVIAEVIAEGTKYAATT